MINKIKNKLNFITQSLAAIDTKGTLSQASSLDHLALTQLLKMFDNKIFIPLTSWSISPNEVLHVCNEIVINKRRNIIEFGSGFSTICIAQLLKINSINTEFFSVENDANWAEELNGILKRMELSDYVKIIVAPIANVPKEFAKANQEKWYDTEVLSKALSNVETIELVLVDGPFGGTTPFARYSAVPFLKNKLNSNYAVFLDDSARESEMKIAQDWQKTLNAKSIDYKRYTYLTNNYNFDIAPFGYNQ